MNAGDEAKITAAAPPQIIGRLDAVASVQWCLYYPAILHLADIGFPPNPENPLGPSIEAYRSGDVPGALALYPEGRVPTDPSERIYLANLVLAAGQANEALQLLSGLSHEAASALRGLIEAVRGGPALAPIEGTTATSLLARSYIAQAAHQLDDALAHARAATQIAAPFGFAWARLAEVEFSLGHSSATLAALNQAFALSPANAHAWTIQGFALASQNKTTESLEAFNRAVALNSGLANAWLGRGLVRIRSGNLEGGRVDLQVAAATEPNRALLRSYLAKTWDLEGETTLAQKEIGRAKDLDPADPTAFLYAALIEQRLNRINPAIDELEKSRDLNNNRRIYRSRLLLDQDRAMRSANLAGVYRDAGMTERSVREATRAVADDYANASAHQFLANSYYQLRDVRQFNLRHETAWQSELLISQLLAPVGGGSLSQFVSEGEYSKLLERDRTQFRSATEYRSNGDWYETASQFGTYGNFSYSLDAEYRSENGFQPNTDLRQLSLYGRIKQQFSPTDSGLLLLQHNDYEGGDLRQYYNPADPKTGASQGYRSSERQEPNAFVGWHHQWGPGHHTVFLAGHLDDKFQASDTNSVIPVLSRPSAGVAPNAFLTRVFDSTQDSRMDAWSAEVQHIATLGSHTLIGGARYQAGDLDTSATQSLHNGRSQFPGPNVFPDIAQETGTDLERTSVYAYDTWLVIESLSLTAGLSYDRIDYPLNIDLAPLDARQRDDERVSPKVGLMWSPLRETHFRAAWTRSLGGLFFDSSIRLEPVQVAGFNQAYRSILPESAGGITPGSRFETFGIGVDHKFPTRTYVSLSTEWLRSESEQSFGAFDWNRQGVLVAQPITLSRQLDFDERSLGVSLNQLIGNHWSLGTTYRLSEADLDIHHPSLPSGITNDPNAANTATLHQLSGNLRMFLDCGFFAELESLWNHQESQGYSVELPGDDFWQFNLFAGHRFLQRRIEVRVGILNLGDQDYRLNPLNLHTEYPRERTFFASARFFF